MDTNTKRKNTNLDSNGKMSFFTMVHSMSHLKKDKRSHNDFSEVEVKIENYKDYEESQDYNRITCAKDKNDNEFLNRSEIKKEIEEKSFLGEEIDQIENIKNLKEIAIQNGNNINIRNKKDTEQNTVKKSKTSGPNTCTQCNKNFSRESGLKAHYKIMHASVEEEQEDQEDREDQEVEFTFKNIKQKKLENSNKIIKCHSRGEIEIFNCQYCQKSFINKTSMKYHQKNNCPKVENKPLKQKKAKRSSIKCEICGKFIVTKFALRTHINNIHLKNMGIKYKCEICKKVFSQKGDLKIHINNIHLNKEDSSLKCKFCNKQFKWKNNLKEHINGVHLRDKDQSLICEFCQQSFSRKYSLRLHINYFHFKGKDFEFKCEYCSKGYLSKFHMQRHINGVHLGVKEPPRAPRHKTCEICQKVLSSKSALKKHIETVHANEKK